MTPSSLRRETGTASFEGYELLLAKDDQDRVVRIGQISKILEQLLIELSPFPSCANPQSIVPQIHTLSKITGVLETRQDIH